MYDLSILVPGIRTKYWWKLYDSIHQSFSGKWEMVFVGPKAGPDDLMDRDNVTFIEDWGTPIRCQQIALIKSKGKWITWAADDGQYYPEALDIGYVKLKQNGFNPMKLVMGKYCEGSIRNFEHMNDIKYYILRTHTPKDYRYISPSYYMLNVGIVSRETLMNLGGWDCKYEVCPMAYNDLAVRLQDSHVDFLIQNEMMFHCTHMPDRTGDHGPIHDAQKEHDEPMFKEFYEYGFPYEGMKGSPVMDIDNWKKAPSHWERRFGKKNTNKFDK